jgi:propanediol utilization protein
MPSAPPLQPGAVLIGPKGRVKLKEGVIIPQRHIHASPGAAKKAGVKNGSVVSVEVKGKRAVMFHNIIVRTHPTYRWHMHVDTDEGNAAGIKHKCIGVLLH